MRSWIHFKLATSYKMKEKIRRFAIEVFEGKIEMRVQHADKEFVVVI